MEFLHGAELDKAILEILAGTNLRCAVAFWGRGAQEYISKDAQIICNLRMGGTNPHVIRKLRSMIGKENLRQLDDLHAKVYIGKTFVVVASANVSINGLGFEGAERAGWKEAGIRLPVSDDIVNWFKSLWEGGRIITDDDLEWATELWKRRPKPSLSSFRAFDPDSELLPLVYVYGLRSDWEANEEEARRSLGQYDPIVRARIEWGIEADENDAKFWENQWVLFCQGTKKQLLDGRSKLYWVHLDRFIDNIWKWIGDRRYRGAVLASDEFIRSNRKYPPEPFKIDNNFIDAFRDVFNGDKYRKLREGGNEEQASLTKQFWHDVKSRYKRIVEGG